MSHLDFNPEVEFFKMLSAFVDEDISSSDYSLGIPYDGDVKLNTKIDVKPLLSSHTYFNKPVSYNRLDLTDVKVLVVSKGTNKTIHDLLDQINVEPLFIVTQKPDRRADYVSVDGFITSADVFNGDIPAMGAKKYIEIPLVAQPQSLFIKGRLILRILNQ
jgi:hypothetical protein